MSDLGRVPRNVDGIVPLVVTFSEFSSREIMVFIPRTVTLLEICRGDVSLFIWAVFERRYEFLFRRKLTLGTNFPRLDAHQSPMSSAVFR